MDETKIDKLSVLKTALVMTAITYILYFVFNVVVSFLNGEFIYIDYRNLDYYIGRLLIFALIQISAGFVVIWIQLKVYFYFKKQREENGKKNNNIP